MVINERRISAHGYYNPDGSLRYLSVFVSRKTNDDAFSEWRYFQRLDSVTFRSVQTISISGDQVYKVESQSCFDEFFGMAKLYEIPYRVEDGLKTFYWGKVFKDDKLVQNIIGGE